MTEIFLRLVHIQAVRGCSYSTARRENKFIREQLGKSKYQDITIQEYLRFEGLTEAEFDKAWNAWNKVQIQAK